MNRHPTNTTQTPDRPPAPRKKAAMMAAIRKILGGRRAQLEPPQKTEKPASSDLEWVLQMMS